MSIWKYVGDEILFSAELVRHEEAAFHALAFKDAINEYTLQLKKKEELAILSLKGAIWGAGFPVMNAEVSPLLGDGKSAISDFLGPCIDQGFRLCSLADTRRIPISVDVAFMLASTIFAAGTKLKLQCEEPTSHKGVPYQYPNIWIDRLDGDRSEEDELLERRKARDPGGIKPYLDELFAKGIQALKSPFIITDPDPLFNQVPAKMNETREKLRQTVLDETYTSKTEVDPTGAPNQPPEPKLPNQPPQAGQSV